MLTTLVQKKKLFIGGVAALVVVVGLVIGLVWSSPVPVQAGQKIIISVKAGSLTDAYGYQFHINYDDDALEYEQFAGSLMSRVDEIQTIFSKQMDGYQLVGATMVGDQPGVSGKSKVVCEMVFTAKQDGTLDDLDITISDINVVTIIDSDLEYVEDLEGWEIVLKVQD